MIFSLQHVSKWKTLHNSDKGKKQISILNDISIDTCGHSIHVILGPSGSGKTTLLRLLNKLESPSAGSIFLDGIDIATIPAGTLRQRVGMVLQVPALFDGTVAENIGYGPALRKLKINDESIRTLLTQVGLADIDIHRDVKQLSIGQQQRISFARALANRPEMLLLDEPTSALDPGTSSRLLELVESIHQELGIGIIMVTHMLQHAKRLATSVCLLIAGKIVEHNQAEKFFEHPDTEAARQFINGDA
ncbi:phosphate ABC transporter ATP-binding protein [candidate division KSB1 bacterium]|nr:phosphate ABC transporter ATP-binding protein [candidate division KSB1 bacterium]